MRRGQEPRRIELPAPPASGASGRPPTVPRFVHIRQTRLERPTAIEHTSSALWSRLSTVRSRHRDELRSGRRTVSLSEIVFRVAPKLEWLRRAEHLSIPARGRGQRAPYAVRASFGTDAIAILFEEALAAAQRHTRRFRGCPRSEIHLGGVGRHSDHPGFHAGCFKDESTLDPTVFI